LCLIGTGLQTESLLALRRTIAGLYRLSFGHILADFSLTIISGTLFVLDLGIRVLQTIPFPGVPWDPADDFCAGAAAGIGADAGAAAGAGSGAAAGAPAEEGGGFDGFEAGGALLEAAGALPTVTTGVILFIVAAETPAFDKSLTKEYGRPAIIFFAVASPTPGRSFSWAALALLQIEKGAARARSFSIWRIFLYTARHIRLSDGWLKD
jgi:hypothetical protein